VVKHSYNILIVKYIIIIFYDQIYNSNQVYINYATILKLPKLYYGRL